MAPAGAGKLQIHRGAVNLLPSNWTIDRFGDLNSTRFPWKST